MTSGADWIDTGIIEVLIELLKEELKPTLDRSVIFCECVVKLPKHAIHAGWLDSCNVGRVFVGKVSDIEAVEVVDCVK